MSASTPGPWIAVDDTQGPCMVMHPTNRKAIASLTDAHIPANGFHEKDLAERCANARLIAAAPDLLSALQAVVAAWGDYPFAGIEQARAAIAKATGATS